MVKVDKGVLDSLYDYIENEYEYVEKYPKILEENPEVREIKPRGENYMSGIFKEVRAFFNWAYKNKIIDTFPFESSERFNDNIKIIFEKAEVTWPAVPSSVTSTRKLPIRT